MTFEKDSIYQQVNKKTSMRKLVGYRFEGNGGVKSKETSVCNSKGKCHSPIFVAYTMFVC